MGKLLGSYESAVSVHPYEYVVSSVPSGVLVEESEYKLSLTSSFWLSCPSPSPPASQTLPGSAASRIAVTGESKADCSTLGDNGLTPTAPVPSKASPV